MNSILLRNLGIEDYAVEVTPPVTESEMTQSFHEMDEVINQSTEVQQDIKTVSSYVEIIENMNTNNSNTIITTEAIYIGLEHVLNKHQIKVDELFPSLESWSYDSRSSKQVSLEKAESLLAGLKEKGNNLLQTIIKKFEEFKQKVITFFRTVWRKMVKSKLEKYEEGIKKLNDKFKNLSDEDKQIIQQKVNKLGNPWKVEFSPEFKLIYNTTVKETNYVTTELYKYFELYDEVLNEVMGVMTRIYENKGYLDEELPKFITRISSNSLVKMKTSDSGEIQLLEGIVEFWTQDKIYLKTKFKEYSQTSSVNVPFNINKANRLLEEFKEYNKTQESGDLRKLGKTIDDLNNRVKKLNRDVKAKEIVEYDEELLLDMSKFLYLLYSNCYKEIMNHGKLIMKFLDAIVSLT